MEITRDLATQILLSRFRPYHADIVYHSHKIVDKNPLEIKYYNYSDQNWKMDTNYNGYVILNSIGEVRTMIYLDVHKHPMVIEWIREEKVKNILIDDETTNGFSN